MRYLKEKETGEILYIDDSSKEGKELIKKAIAGGRYTEWFIYNAGGLL